MGFGATDPVHHLASEGPEDLGAFFDLVDYPYYVVTVRAPDADMSGCLAGFVTQCSIHPPNFLVCISKVNHTLSVAERSPGMGLHLLGADQSAMACLFGEETGRNSSNSRGKEASPPHHQPPRLPRNRRLTPPSLLLPIRT